MVGLYSTSVGYGATRCDGSLVTSLDCHQGFSPPRERGCFYAASSVKRCDRRTARGKRQATPNLKRVGLEGFEAQHEGEGILRNHRRAHSEGEREKEEEPWHYLMKEPSECRITLETTKMRFDWFVNAIVRAIEK